MMNRQEHLLVVLSEECSEVIKDVSKALRFGLDDIKPNQTPNLELTNSDKITNELADVFAVVDMLVEEGIIFMPTQSAITEKKYKVEHFIKYAINNGSIKIK